MHPANLGVNLTTAWQMLETRRDPHKQQGSQALSLCLPRQYMQEISFSLIITKGEYEYNIGIIVVVLCYVNSPWKFYIASCH